MHGHLCDATMELNGGSRLSTVWEACQRNVLQPIERTVAGAQSRALQPFVGGDVWLTQNVLMFGRLLLHTELLINVIANLHFVFFRLAFTRTLLSWTHTFYTQTTTI